MPPMAAVAAIAEPVMAAKNMQARMLTMARPLGKCPSRVSAKSTRRLDMPPRNISSPASMNRGMAIRAMLSPPVNMRWITTISGIPLWIRLPRETMPSAKQMGTPMKKAANKHKMITITALPPC